MWLPERKAWWESFLGESTSTDSNNGSHITNVTRTMCMGDTIQGWGANACQINPKSGNCFTISAMRLPVWKDWRFRTKWLQNTLRIVCVLQSARRRWKGFLSASCTPPNEGKEVQIVHARKAGIRFWHSFSFVGFYSQGQTIPACERRWNSSLFWLRIVPSHLLPLNKCLPCTKWNLVLKRTRFFLFQIYIFTKCFRMVITMSSYTQKPSPLRLGFFFIYQN